MSATVPVEMLEAVALNHRLEVATLTMRIVRYREALEEAGIDPPDNTDDELLNMWRDCSAVITTASEFVAKLGPAKEMLAATWKPAA